MATTTMTLFPISRRIAAATIRAGVRTSGSVIGVPAPVVAVLARVLRVLEPVPEGGYTFLTPEWVTAMGDIRDSYRGKTTIAPPAVRVNFVVTKAPFGDGTVFAHTDTTSGEVEFELGHLDDADLTVTLPYDAARALLVDSDINVAMSKMASGEISIDGDMSKLLTLHAIQVDATTLEAAQRIQAMTA